MDRIVSGQSVERGADAAAVAAARVWARLSVLLERRRASCSSVKQSRFCVIHYVWVFNRKISQFLAKFYKNWKENDENSEGDD